jgi:DNA-directed RNA polymerase subunit M/transcription elongation factor TFIIS
MNSQDPPKTTRRRLTTVTCPRPRCPRCQGVRLRKYRSQGEQGDGSTLSYVRCLDADCGHRFRLLLE